MFSPDQPISTQKADLLGRNAFANELAKSILGYEQIDSISVGLFGEWGSGKTSMVNMVIEALEEETEHRPLIMKFNPWNFSDQNQLIQQFFNELSLILCRDSKTQKQIKIGKAIQKYSSFFEPLSYVPVVSNIGKAATIFKRIGRATEKAGEAKGKNIGIIKNELNCLLKEIDTKLIIVIDDIDRLNNSEIRQIFQLVKSLADFQNTIYLLSFDKNVVINALKKVQEGSGNDYLEKVVQVPFEIPQISKKELEHFLFNKMNDLIKDIPEEHWNQTYWGNIYHSGLKHLFKNMRDVNRYLNTLSFNFCLVKNEVNPIDLIAITAIQIFITSLHKIIKNNKELFSGVSDTYTTNSDKILEEEKTKLTDILSHIDELPSDITRDFLQRIFPKLESVGYSESILDSWRKKGRICSPDIFDTYFRLFIPQDELSLREIERIIKTGSDSETFSMELLELNRKNKIIQFIERMEDYTKEDIPEENIAPIICVLMDIGDLFPPGERGMLQFDTPMRLLRIFFQLSHRFDEQNKRFEIFSNSINRANQSIYTLVHEVQVQCQQHGKHGFDKERESSKKTTVTPEQLDELVKMALTKIKEWADDGKLAQNENLLSILFTWQKWDEPNEINKFVQSLVATDEGLVQLVKKFLHDVKSYGTKDYVGKVTWKINLENIATFMKLEDVEKRLRKIYDSPEYSSLGEKERLAIKTFIDTIDGKVDWP
jgi:predicted KAP-like P-loop ATPase